MIKQKKTLVIQPLPGLGDMLWYLPYFRSLARQTPTGKITLLTKQKSQAKDLLKGEDFIEEVLYLEKEGTSSRRSIWKLLHEIKKRDFQSVWVLHHSAQYAFLAYIAGIPERHGYGFKWQKLWLTGKHYLKPRLFNTGTLERVTTFMKVYDFHLEKEDVILKLSQSEILHIRERFKEAVRPWYVLGVGASQDFKRWSPDHFAALAQKLAQQGTVFLLASPTEKSINECILSKIKNREHLIQVSDLTISQAATLISQAKCFIGNCSGPLNIAASVNVPSVGLFGATEILSYSDNFIPISPTPENKPLKMDGIFPDQVIEVLKKYKLFE